MFQNTASLHKCLTWLCPFGESVCSLSLYIHTYRKGVGLDDIHSKLNVVAIVSCCIAIGFKDCKAFFLVFRLVSEIYRKDQSSKFSNDLCPL